MHRSIWIMIALTLLTGSEALAGVLKESLFLEVGFDDAGCTHLSCGQLKEICWSKLAPRAIRGCLEEDYSGKVLELENSFDYACGTAGACHSTSGTYTSFACSSVFRCD